MRVLLAAAALLCTGCAGLLADLDAVRDRDPLASATPEDGLKEALRVGTGRAVDLLGRADGYLGNAEVRVPLPDKLTNAGRALRTIGAGQLVDEFETSMNRAAEAAAPLARQVFVDTVRGMTIRDALTILNGDGHEATDYLQANAGPQLRSLFLPLVAGRLDAVGATREFRRLADRAEQLPFVDRPLLDLEGYVTDRALDGLFLMIAREEERIRTDPLARTTALLRKFFGRD